MPLSRCDPRRRPRAGPALALLAALALARPAAASDDDTVVGYRSPPRYRVFVYEKPTDKNYFRVALEEVAVLAVGTVEYFQNQNINEGDWDLKYTGGTFEDKVAGRALAFDANKFGTNWILHPLGGWLYYQAARGNRLGPAGSLFVAASTSAVWEWLGEYREKAAINDLIVTPVAGMAVSEPLLQLGAWFERGRPSFGRNLMANVLAPSKRLHDALDEAEPLRDFPRKAPNGVDDLPRGDLSARAYAGVGPTWLSTEDDAYTDLNAGVRTHLFNAPSPYDPGVTRSWLDDANLSTLHLDFTANGAKLVDARFATRVALVGHYTKRVSTESGEPRGHAMFIGLGSGFDYQWHRYGRAAQTQDDQIALVELLGSTVENWHVLGPVKIRTQMALAFDFAGVTSLARDERIRRKGPGGLPTVVRTEGYSHAFGGTLAPQLKLEVRGFTAYGEARLDVFRSIIDRDRFYEKYDPNVTGGDERLLTAAGLEYAFLPNFDVGVRFLRTFRRSRLDDVTKTYGETGLRLDAALRL